jgi:hypothetical protein
VKSYSSGFDHVFQWFAINTATVDYQFSVFGDKIVINCRMVGGYQNSILGSDYFARKRL